jgi:hypothetical protein
MSYRNEGAMKEHKKIAVSPSGKFYAIYYGDTIDYYNKEGRLIWRKCCQGLVNHIRFVSDHSIAVILFPHDQMVK